MGRQVGTGTTFGSKTSPDLRPPFAVSSKELLDRYSYQSFLNHWFGNSLFYGNCLEKRVAKNPVFLCCSVQALNAFIKGVFVN